MFDIKWIRQNAQEFDAAMHRRGIAPPSARLIEIDDQRRAAIQSVNQLQEERNAASKQIGHAKSKGDEEGAKALMEQVAGLKARVQEGEEAARTFSAALDEALLALPNMLYDDVPEGRDESDNVELRVVGTRSQFAFEPKEHFDLGEALGQMDFEAAARMAGSRFVVLRGPLARLERALGQFMLDLQTEVHGFVEHQVPLLVRDEALLGTGQLPKFAEDAFHTTDGRWLIPTSEVPLTNLVREQILNEDQLPMRATALTACFRAEAGSAGRDTRGMLRQHQFYKVEMVSATTPENSDQEQLYMLDCAENVLKKLDIPYRVVRLCTGDMGATMRRTFDIEAWLPGQKSYREISSVSTAGDWQARRMNARLRRADGSIEFMHTLNGSGIAVGRALIAVMENYQQEDGSIAIPSALQPYMGRANAIQRLT